MSESELAEAQKKADDEMRAHWKVEDGALVFDGKGQSLCTAKDYGDFELYVDWKIKRRRQRHLPARHAAGADLGSAQQRLGSGGSTTTRRTRASRVKADNPIGEWNTFYIKMVGERVTVKLNGELVVDNVVLENYWERDKPIYPTGQIELQNHGNTLYFRNIYLRELPDDVE